MNTVRVIDAASAATLTASYDMAMASAGVVSLALVSGLNSSVTCEANAGGASDAVRLVPRALQGSS